MGFRARIVACRPGDAIDARFARQAHRRRGRFSAAHHKFRPTGLEIARQRSYRAAIICGAAGILRQAREPFRIDDERGDHVAVAGGFC